MFTKTVKILFIFCTLFIITFTIYTTVIAFVLYFQKQKIENYFIENTDISLYVNNTVNQTEINQLITQLSQHPLVKNINFINSENNLKNFSKNILHNFLVSELDNNPLPNTIIIHPILSKLSKITLLKFIQNLKDQIIIESLNFDLDWIMISSQWIRLLNYITTFLLTMVTIFMVLNIIGINFLIHYCINTKNNISYLPKKLALFNFCCGVLAIISSRFTIHWLNNNLIPVSNIGIDLEICILAFIIIQGYLNGTIITIKEQRS